jgi:hypothetical protein
MNLLLHHLRKDLRLLFRWPLLLLFAQAIGVVVWYASLPPVGRAEHFAVLPFWHYSIWLLCFFLCGGLVQRDAPLNEGGFIRTRPGTLFTVLGAKALAAVTLLLPFALIHCLSLLMLGLRPGWFDLFLIFTEEMLMLSALGAVGMAISIRQESLGKFLSSVVLWGGVVFVGWITYAWCSDAYFRHARPEWSRDLDYLKISRMLMAWLVALMGAVLSILLFARTRSRQTASISLAFAAVITIATLLFWPINFVKTFAPAQREAPKREWPDQTKLRFAFEEQRVGRDGTSIFSFGDGEDDGGRYRQIRGFSRITGLGDGWQAADQNSYESRLTLSNGRSFDRTSIAWAGLNPATILPRLGIPGDSPDPNKRIYQFELAKLRLEDVAGALTDASLSGTMRIHLKRPVILARIPLRKGATAVVDGRLITITDVENSGNEISYNFVTQTHMVHLHGGWQKIWTNRFEYVVIHEARREALYRQGNSQSNRRTGHHSIQREDGQGKLMRRYEELPIPPDWIDGAELLVIGDENGGTFSQSFDFPNINLSDQR